MMRRTKDNVACVVVVVFGFVGACQTGFWMKQLFVVWRFAGEGCRTENDWAVSVLAWSGQIRLLCSVFLVLSAGTKKNVSAFLRRYGFRSDVLRWCQFYGVVNYYGEAEQITTLCLVSVQMP